MYYDFLLYFFLFNCSLDFYGVSANEVINIKPIKGEHLEIQDLIDTVAAFERLSQYLKKEGIECNNYETICSQIIEGSEQLKDKSEQVQHTCETKLKPLVCPMSTTTSPTTFASAITANDS